MSPARVQVPRRRPRRADPQRVPLLPPRGERLAPALSGGLLVLSFPPVELLVPPFIALVPFLLFLADRPPGSAGRWSAARAGYFLGLVYFGLLLYWKVWALVYYSLLAIPAYILSVVILAGFTAAFAAGLHYALDRTAAPLALAAAVFWTATEWLQAHAHDLSFPWLGLGTALGAFPRVAGAADLVGARGLTFWIVLVNGLIASGILAWRAGRPVHRLAAASLLLVVAPIGYGAWRAATLELRPAARVAIVQPNIPEELKLDPRHAMDTSVVALSALTSRIEPGSVDLVVWPEVALPDVLEHPTRDALRDWVRGLSAAADAPILVGMYGWEAEPGGRGRFYNSAIVMDAAGFTGPRYDKNFLVPFVERVPFVDAARLLDALERPRNFGALEPGRAAPVLAASRPEQPDDAEGGGGREAGGAEAGRRANSGGAGAEDIPAATAAAGFGVLICYESIFAGHSRRFRLGGADYLVNVTNDAWFGREASHTRTTALWQHPAHLPMRAIENRIGIARAANTGISFFVDPLGRRYEITELFVPDVRTGTVYTTDAVTLYARWGDWLATGAALAAVLLLLAARVGRPAAGRLTSEGWRAVD